VIRVWGLGPFGVYLKKAVRIRVIRVWRIRVPWNIFKMSHRKLLGLGSRVLEYVYRKSSHKKLLGVWRHGFIARDLIGSDGLAVLDRELPL
jgi:hypothetical protein